MNCYSNLHILPTTLMNDVADEYDLYVHKA